MTTVTVVTPWRDHLELAPAYWAAIDAGVPERVLVVDDGSDPPLYGRVVLEGDGDCNCRFDVRFGVPVGFSRCCNAGLQVASRMGASSNPDPTDAVVFLNNDVRLGDPGWLEAIREELRPGVLVGAQLRNDPHAAIDGRNQPYLDGWCLAGMTADLLALGGFDETFEEPAYYGDNDLCLRARHAGFRLVQARAALHHLGGVTRRGIDGIVDGVTARNYERYAAKARALHATGRAA